jgi:WD40 repeat protein/serine/threonine protein kinase
MPATLFCIICGREFRPRDADTVICPDCGGPPEAPAPSQPQGTVLADQPRGTVLMSQPAYQRMCILCGQDFTTADPQADRCPQCRGEAPHPQPEIRSRPESRQSTPAMPAAAQGTVAVSESSLSPAPSSADVPLTWNAGDVILDLYEVKGELGKGGMGVVYRVHHRQWNMDLAVKTPLPEALQKAGSLENFLREAQAWVDLGLHPHIVTCYYVRRLGEMPRVFAECMEGGSLKNWMEDGRLYAGGEQEALKRILDCAIQFAWGLGYAHEKGLVHQDVKPANALMTPDGMLKVADFGLVGAKGYTPAYAAPEQELGQAVSPRTDIWGWGVSVLEMFTGGVHWQFGSVAASVLENYLQESPPEGIPPMPAALAELLRQCFQNDPEQRPASMDEVAERLMHLYEQETGAPYPRPKPQALDLRAGSLNNKAVSLLDLGQEEEAVRCWQEALQAEPHDLESNLNLIHYKWVNGFVDVEKALKRLDMLVSYHREDANFWYCKFLLELELVGTLGFSERTMESASEALLRGSGEKIMGLARQLLREDIRQWSHPGAKGVYETSKVILEELIRQYIEYEECEAIETDEITTWVSYFSPGKLLVGTKDGFVKLWNRTNRQYETMWKIDTDPIRSLHVSSPMALVDCERKVVLLNVETNELFQVAHSYLEQFTYLCVSNSCGSVQAFSYTVEKRNISHDLGTSEVVNQKVNLWNIFERKIIACTEIEPNEKIITYSPDGSYFITCDQASRFFLRRTGTSKKWSLEFSYPLSSFIFTTSNHIIACSYFPPYLYVVAWSIENETVEKTTQILMGPGSPFSLENTKNVLGFDQSGKYLFTVTSHNAIQVWDLENRTLFRSYFARSISEWFGSPNKHLMQLMLAVEKPLTLWMVLRENNKWKVAKLRKKEIFSYLLATPTTYEAVYQVNRRYQELLTQSRKLIAEHRHKNAYYLLLQSVTDSSELLSRPDFLDMIYACGQKGRRTSLRNFYLRKQFTNHQGPVAALDFGPNNLLVSGSWDKTIMIWDIHSLSLLKTLAGHALGINVILFSPDGTLILSGSADTTVRLWNASNGECLRVFEGHSQGISAIAFSPNMKMAASGSWDTTVRVWSIVTGECIAVLKGIHTSKVTTVEFISDFEVFSSDGIRVRWDLRNDHINTYRGTPSFPPPIDSVTIGNREIKPPHKREIMCTSLAPDGRFFATGSVDHTICLFELLWDYDFPAPADWDEGARPYLDIFLTLHTPYGPDGLSRVGKPQWTEEDFQKLLQELGYRGYGWLRPEGVRRELEKMAKERK